MPSRIPYLSLANPGNRLRITPEGDEPFEVTVVEVLNRAVRVRYPGDQSVGVLHDDDYDDDVIEVLHPKY